MTHQTDERGASEDRYEIDPVSGERVDVQVAAHTDVGGRLYYFADVENQRACKGRRFDTWAELEQAVTEATAYWNAHKHPFVWGRRHHTAGCRAPRLPGLAHLPKAA